MKGRPGRREGRKSVLEAHLRSGDEIRGIAGAGGVETPGDDVRLDPEASGNLARSGPSLDFSSGKTLDLREAVPMGLNQPLAGDGVALAGEREHGGVDLLA